MKKKRLKYQLQQMLEGNVKLVLVVMKALPILEERFHPARRLNGPTSTRGAVQTVPTCMNLMFVYKHKYGRNNHATKKKTRGSATEF